MLEWLGRQVESYVTRGDDEISTSLVTNVGIQAVNIGVIFWELAGPLKAETLSNADIALALGSSTILASSYIRNLLNIFELIDRGYWSRPNQILISAVWHWQDKFARS